MNYYLAALKKYAVFSGRAQRAEYWYFVLFSAIIYIVLSIISLAISKSSPFPILGSLYSLAVLIPSFAVFIRRLHDTNHSGWWWFIGLIPLVGVIILLVFLIRDSQPGDNQYGPNPKRIALT